MARFLKEKKKEKTRMEASPPPPPPPLCESSVNAFHAAAFALVTSLHAELSSLRTFRETTTRRLEALENDVEFLRLQFSEQKTPSRYNSRPSDIMEYVTPTTGHSIKTPKTKRSRYNSFDRGDTTTVTLGPQNVTFPSDTKTKAENLETTLGAGSTAHTKQVVVTPCTGDSKLKRAPRHSRRPITPGANTAPSPNAIINLFPAEHCKKMKEPTLKPKKGSNSNLGEVKHRGTKRSLLSDENHCLGSDGKSYDKFFDETNNADSASDENRNKMYTERLHDEIVSDKSAGSKERSLAPSVATHGLSKEMKKPSVQRNQRTERPNTFMNDKSDLNNTTKITTQNEADGHSAQKKPVDRPSVFSGLRTAGAAVRAAEDIQAAQRRSEIGQHVQEVVRGAERAALSAHVCPECETFFRSEAASRSNPDLAYRDLVQAAGRHRCRHKAPATPEDFWKLSFDTTDSADSTQPP